MTRITFSILLLLTLLAPPAHAQPAILNNVTIDQRLGQSLPLDTLVRDESGRTIPLSDCFHQGRPVLLSFVYYDCPGLCTTTLNQLARSLNAIPESAGQRFDVITLSFDPRETPALATSKKQTYLRTYRRPTADAGWRFLTAPDDSVRRLTQAAGFRYAWDDTYKLFAHASALIVLSPQGTITRYFLGIDYPPTEVRRAIADAAENHLAPPAERVFLYCFHYDPTTGHYGLIIDRTLRIAGVITILALAGLITLLLHRERRPAEVAP